MPWTKNRPNYFWTLLFCHSVTTVLSYGCFAATQGIKKKLSKYKKEVYEDYSWSRK